MTNSRPAAGSPACTPRIEPAPATPSVLIFALSGLGKSHLAARYPQRTYDTDTALRGVLAREFADDVDATDERALFIEWRRFARLDARRDHRRPEWQRWARVRRQLHREIRSVLTSTRATMVLTNFLCIPWSYSAYYGIEVGRYVEHFARSGRARDNEQIEEKNTELEGYEPLVRMPPGAYLGDRPELLAWLDDHPSDATP